jgi:hypothetical protein
MADHWGCLQVGRSILSYDRDAGRDYWLGSIEIFGRRGFYTDTTAGWPIAYPRNWECRLHWIAMSSSNSLQKPRRNTSSFRNSDHFGFGGRSARRRCNTFSRSSYRSSSTRAAGYRRARGATVSHLSGCKTDSQHYHVRISAAPTTAVLNSRFYKTVPAVSLC